MNTIRALDLRESHSRKQPERAWWALPAALAATLTSLPGHAGDAFSIPSTPMTVSSRQSANLLFMLDDSGSMGRIRMPIDSDGQLKGTVEDNSPTHNTVMYDPKITYEPWYKHDGTRFTDGTKIDEVYSDFHNVGGNTIDLMNSSSCKSATQNGSSLSVCGSVENRTFFILKDNQTADKSKNERYFRYQLLYVNGVAQFVRSQWGKKADAGDFDSSLGCPSGGGGKNTNGWRGCTVAVPHTRSQEEEVTNFATWFSYYRTRMKLAKGGASEAFVKIGRNFRVGFGAINNSPKVSYRIPVTQDNGEFFDNNKKDFFEKLQDEPGGGNTPLRTALKAAGAYYQEESSGGTKGPWWSAPDATDISCRQSFTILTSDGFYNDSMSGIGNADGAAGHPYSDDKSNTLADVAYYYYITDLQNTLDDNVPTSVDDSAKHQHMTTFTVSIGLKGHLDPEVDLPALKAGTKGWWDSGTTETAKIDDLWHAAVNGRGSFVVANNPTEFANALRSALSTIDKRNTSFSNVATNSVSLDVGAKVFNASYTSGDWSGEVKASSIDSNGVQGVVWEATKKLPAWADRKIFTSQAGSGTTFPSSSQGAETGPLARSAGDYIVTAANNANYIRGDRSLESQNGGKLRDRSTPLGDVVDSSPAFSKETNTVYVGANDGMLHAFDADSGVELFAYVPSILDIAGLGALSRGDYGSTDSAHSYFVDGPLTVSQKTLTNNRNLLVGTLGRGGKGLFALDVTDRAPASSVAASSMFKWELEETSGNNMGLVLGKPVIARVPGGDTAVIFGNGINSANHEAVLVVLKLNASTNAVASQVEISTGVGNAASPNGLSAPTAVYAADGKTIEFVYAGDMRGNVWRFDLNDNSVKHLFAAGSTQPITGGVTVARDPSTNKRWVLFGTGSFLVDGDKTSKTTQSMYGLIDHDSAIPLQPSDLVNNTPSSWATGTVSGMSVRTFKEASALSKTASGWRVDLPAGERVVQDSQVVATYLITASVNPTGGSTDPCKPGGTGYINALDAFSGTSAASSYFDVNKSGGTKDDKLNNIAIGSIDVGMGMPTLPNLLRGLLVVGGTGGAELRTPRTSAPRWDRVSWREIRQD